MTSRLPHCGQPRWRLWKKAAQVSTHAAAPSRHGGAFGTIITQVAGAACRFSRDLRGQRIEDENGAVTSQSQTWFFTTSDSRDKIVEYYKQRFPEATMSNDESGDVVFKRVPTGAEDGESLCLGRHR